VYALANNERFGVWGGLSERQRRRLRDGGRSLVAVDVRRRPGPEPLLSDSQLIEFFTAADPRQPAAPQLQVGLGVSQATAYKYLRRARALGMVERRGRVLHPAG
jgi:hypothetical protein